MAASLAPALKSILKSLPPGTSDQSKFNELAKRAIHETSTKGNDENRKSQWEHLLKNEIYTLAATEGTALRRKDTTYYDRLRDRLDLILAFTEQGACEPVFPFTILQDLLETQTIASCSHVFSWIEERSQRLTSGMVPQKGKALVLLRTLNDLLRRLSKMGSTTIFCGRILTFLSGVFPLGERSGVNLRGEYGPMWEGVKAPEQVSAKKEEDERDADVAAGEKMQVDQDKPEDLQKPAKSKKDFYSTFWSLQLPFSRPPLFASSPQTFAEFKEAVDTVLPYIKEANAKDRAMLGSRSGSGPNSLKRKREPEGSNATDYFFAKFLTSPDLLELEIADTHFRRQFLFQLLILLHHLLTFTKSAKAAWSSPRNRSLQMEFTLDPADAQWAQETVNRAMDELRQTTPNGRVFSETVSVILGREKNWVKWKNELCAPFDKETWRGEVEGGRSVGLEEATRDAREKFMMDAEDWPWKLGSEPLTEIWDMGYRDLQDLEHPFDPGNVKDYSKKVQQEDARIKMRKNFLTKNAERTAQARAKAQASVTGATPTTAAGQSESPLPVKAETATPSRPAPATPAPLHPSLPPKPGTASPQKPSSSSEPAEVSVPAPSPAAQAPTAAPPPVAAPAQVDEQLSKYEENKQRWSWLALRTARDVHLQHFGKIGTGDVLLLAQEIEKDIADKEEQKKTVMMDVQEEKTLSVQPGGPHDDRSVSPQPGNVGVSEQMDVKVESPDDK